MSYNNNPSAIGMKLLACGRSVIDTTSPNDLATYVDCTPFEEVLFVLISSKLGAEGTVPETGTDVSMACREASVADGTGSGVVNDRDGNALLVALGGSAAAGRTASMQVRCTGRKQFLSPALVATGSAVTCCYAVYGIGVRDSAEVSAHWVGEAGAVLASTAIS